MQPDRLSDEQLDDLAAELAPRLPTGTHGDRVILPRRTFAAAIGGTLGVGALTTLGVDRATAQAAGRQGTPDDPNDMFAWDLNVANQVTSDLPMGGHDVTDVGTLNAERAGIAEMFGQLSLSTTQTIPPETLGTVAYDTIESDELAAWDTDTHEFIAPVDGLYFFTAGVEFNATFDSDRVVLRFDEPTESRFQYDNRDVTTSRSTFSTVGIVRMSANDTQRVRVFQTSASGADIETSRASAYFTYARLG